MVPEDMALGNLGRLSTSDSWARLWMDLELLLRFNWIAWSEQALQTACADVGHNDLDPGRCMLAECYTLHGNLIATGRPL